MATIDQILGPQRERVRASCEAAGIAPATVLRDAWEFHGDNVTVTILHEDGRRECRSIPLLPEPEPQSLDELLGIDPTNPVDRLAGRLVEADHSLIETLQQRRRDLGLTHEDLAERMGMSVEYVRGLDRYDADCNLATMRRWKLALGIAVEYVITPVPAAVDD